MSGKDRILLVADKVDDCQLMSLVLREHLSQCTVESVNDAVSFAEWLTRGGFAVAVVGQDLAWAEADRVLAALRRHRPGCRLFMVAAHNAQPPVLSAEQQAMTEVLPRTSGGLLALPERIRSSLAFPRTDLSAAESAGSGEPPPRAPAATLWRPARADAEREPARPAWSSEELEELAYALSHDLLGTVHLVDQYARLLKEGCQDRLDPDAVRYLDHLLSGSQRLTEMVETVLGHLRSSKREDSTPVDFGAVVREAVQHLGVVVDEAHARIEWSALPTLTANHHQMVQLFQNLIANAIKHRSEEPPRIEITVVEHANQWEFAIKDNGEGIDTDNQGRIFRLFHRLGTPDQASGNGIGLAMCKRIVERHGGRIWVESRLGEGSTFFFTVAKDG